MANPNWIGGAPAVAQINTITITNVASTNTFSITIGNATLTVTAGGGDTVTSIAAALVALASAASAPLQFSEATWTNLSGVITMTQKAAYAGQPIVQTSGATGGSASAATATTTASSGPNNWSVAANWSTGVVPAGGDTVTITGAASDILYGLDQHTITLAALIVNSKTVKIGLPTINGNSTPGYPEYRPQYLQIGATALNVIQASGRVKIDGYTVQFTGQVENSQQSIDNAAGIPAVLLKGTNANNALYVTGGSVGVAYFGGETATIKTLGTTGGSVWCGSGVTLSTLVQNAGGSITLNSSAATIQNDPAAGTTTILGGTSFTMISVYGGTLSYETGGTIVSLTVNLKGVADFSNQIQARTVTNATIAAGGTIHDPSGTVTWSNPISLNGCRIADVTLDFGLNLNIAM